MCVSVYAHYATLTQSHRSPWQRTQLCESCPVEVAGGMQFGFSLDLSHQAEDPAQQRHPTASLRKFAERFVKRIDVLCAFMLYMFVSDP